jgi:hypothetical protein
MYLKVYCVLVHKNPSQIKELISLLQDDHSLFFIHLDKKINLNSYKELLNQKNCFFVKKRVACSWGKYSLVQATLNAMKEVHDLINANYSGAKYHFIMLSGEDLPLTTNQQIQEYLSSNTETSFINYWELPYEKWWQGGLFRLENLYLFEYKKHPKWNYWLNRAIKKLQFNFLLPLNQFKKRFSGFKIYGSSQWMLLNQDLVAFVLKESCDNPKFNSIFKYVLAPDELYFATLILNYDKQKQFKINNVTSHLVCFNGADPSPKYLQIEDIEKNDNENLLFARKFDPSLNQNAIEFVKKTLIR